MSVLTEATIMHDLGVDVSIAENIHGLLKLAYARGRAGRWPTQLFEDAADWSIDGDLIDRIAYVSNVPTADLLELYMAAHLSGIARTR